MEACLEEFPGTLPLIFRTATTRNTTAVATRVGLKGKEIPLVARIFAVVDVYDALTSTRPYREAWSKEKSLELIIQDSGKHFDPQVVEVFLDEVSKGS